MLGFGKNDLKKKVTKKTGLGKRDYDHKKMYDLLTQKRNFLNQSKRQLKKMRDEYYAGAKKFYKEGNVNKARKRLAFVQNYDTNIMKVEKKMMGYDIMRAAARVRSLEDDLYQGEDVGIIQEYGSKVLEEINNGIFDDNEINDIIGVTNNILSAQEASNSEGLVTDEYVPSVEELYSGLETEIELEEDQLGSSKNELEEALKQAQG